MRQRILPHLSQRIYSLRLMKDHSASPIVQHPSRFWSKTGCRHFCAQILAHNRGSHCVIRLRLVERLPMERGMAQFQRHQGQQAAGVEQWENWAQKRYCLVLRHSLHPLLRHLKRPASE
jgi:hypothetical protein